MIFNLRLIVIETYLSDVITIIFKICQKMIKLSLTEKSMYNSVDSYSTSILIILSECECEFYELLIIIF